MKKMTKSEFIDAIKIALVVGTVLCTINQLDLILSKSVSTKDAIRMGMNYMVPFLVASYSKMQMRRKQHN